MGPIVKLENGNVLKLESYLEAKEIYKDVILPFKGSYELIVYESGSTDKTRSILIDLQKKFSLINQDSQKNGLYFAG